MRTKHPVPCFAMRIVEDRTKKTVVYTADSATYRLLSRLSHRRMF